MHSKHWIKWRVHLLVSTFFILTANHVPAEVIDKIAIVVNDEFITEGEIEMMLAPKYQQYRTLYDDDELIVKLEEERQRIIEQLIEDRLMIGEARKLNVQVDEREIDERIDEAIRRFGSKEDFERALSGQRLTLKDVRKRYGEQLMIRRLVDMKVGARIMVTPVEISNYYDAHKNDFAHPEEIRLRNILIKADEDIQRKANLTKEVMARLKEGGDFGELAKLYSEGPGASEGGMMGYVKRGDLLPEIEKVIFDMKAGEVSDIVQTNLGYHIFKVEEKKDARIISLAEARREVEDAVFRTKIQEKSKGWIESLKKDAYIAFK